MRFVSSTFLVVRSARTYLAGTRMASTKAAEAFGLKDPSLIHTQGLIGGKWLDAKDGKTFEVTNPATNKVLGSVADMGVSETKEAVAAASDAFRSWSKTTAKQRHDLLMKLYKLMLENNDDLARIITLENGKVLAEAKGENAYSASFVEWFAEEGIRAYGEVIPSPVPNIRSVVIKQPVGVCGILTPWNFPSAMITRKVAPALAAGCTVVIKPPLETPFSALAIGDLAARAGIPDGVINIITSSAHTKDVGKELCENPTVRKISFTGSTAVAKTLYAQSASTMKKVSFEAGGNAAFIIFDDADVEEAVTGLVACKFRGTGQTCVSANRIYVQSGVYAEFASLLAQRVEAMKVGNGLDDGITHGPLIHSRAVDKVEAHVNDAVQNGASVLTGGKRLEGNFFEPTVLADVPPTAVVSREETFGPLAALIKFEAEDELLKLANNTEFGLASYLFSRDVGRVWRVAEALEVGMVGANTGMISNASIPFGGIKDSGLGREGSRHGLNEYLNIKYIAFGGL